MMHGKFGDTIRIAAVNMYPVPRIENGGEMHNIAQSRMPRGTQLRVLTITAALLAAALFSATAAQAWTYKVIHSFCGGKKCSDGEGPEAALAMDASGNLYGTTYFPVGAVFKLDISGSKPRLKVLYSFCRKQSCADGEQPRSSVIFDNAGNLYGTTLYGGKYGNGTIYRLSPPAGDKSKWSLQVLHDFCSACGDGNFAFSGLTYSGAQAGARYDGTSPLYGTTEIGGAYNGGIAYQLRPSGTKSRWRETILYSFCAQGNCTDGLNPYKGNLLIDNQGRLLGTTQYGGANDGGTVFQLTPTGKNWNYTVLYSFCAQQNCADGLYPIGGIYEDKQGNLFGTTAGDVGYLGGNVFELIPQGQQYELNVLHTFCLPHFCDDGSRPWATVIADPNGNLYSTTQYGGGNYEDYCDCGGGTVFSISDSTETILHAFCAKNECKDGDYPVAPLIMDSAGNLFGTTDGGGNGGGVVFELSP
jgi:uncharacterized repeat protein (TIGR03803 family)